jgi:hypothetical protein
MITTTQKVHTAQPYSTSVSPLPDGRATSPFDTIPDAIDFEPPSTLLLTPRKAASLLAFPRVVSFYTSFAFPLLVATIPVLTKRQSDNDP